MKIYSVFKEKSQFQKQFRGYILSSSRTRMFISLLLLYALFIEASIPPNEHNTISTSLNDVFKTYKNAVAKNVCLLSQGFNKQLCHTERNVSQYPKKAFIGNSRLGWLKLNFCRRYRNTHNIKIYKLCVTCQLDGWSKQIAAQQVQVPVLEEKKRTVLERASSWSSNRK